MWTVLGTQQMKYVQVSYDFGSSCRFVCGGPHDKHAVQREFGY